MKIKKDSIFGILTSITFLFPNLIWLIYIPFLAVFVTSSFFLYLNNSILNNSITISLLVSLTFLFEPSSTKYGILFIVNFVCSLVFTYAMQKSEFRIFFLKSAAFFLVLSFVITFLFNPTFLYQTRSDYFFNQDTIFRQRNFFSEPAFLGYWAALLCLISIRYNFRFLRNIFVVFFLLSTSVGALFYLSSGLALLQRKFNLRKLIIFIIFASLIIIVFRERIAIKFQSNSFDNRLFNAELTFRYIKNYFPIPKGFGPMIFPNIEIGVLSFILLLLKSLGGLILIPIVLNFKRIVNYNIFLLPAIVISCSIVNFWEAPIVLSYIYLPGQLNLVEDKDLNI